MGSSNLPEALITALGALGIFLIYIWFRTGEHELLLKPLWWYYLAISLTGAFIWFHGLKRGRLTKDIAKSRLESSAQGYGWLVGKTGRPPEHEIICAPNGYECVWYRYYERGSGGGNGGIAAMFISMLPNHIGASAHETQQTIIINDRDELYYVYPDGAQVLSHHRMDWDGAMGEYAIDYIAPGEEVYILGELSSHEHHFDRLREVNHLLTDMQADPAQRERFDTNNNGRLEDDEMDSLHHEAIRLADIREHEQATIKPINHIRKPTDGREFIISNIPPKKLRRHYTRQMMIGLLFFFGAGSLCVMYLPIVIPN